MRFAILTVALCICASPGWAYYFFVHYAGRSAPFFPMPEKFDLNSLQNNTVYFYIADSGPSGTATNDGFPAIVSEIRSAAQAWNTIKTSAIRLAYGGLYRAGSGEINSGITVEFSDDVPPGVIARGAPITFSGGPNGQFVPIQSSTILIQRDLSQPQTACSNSPCPSFSEYFYTTMVHEFGHTLGLQHTFTSAVMSTYVTSAATKASPLGMDDIMGVSLLYPTADFASLTGAISGAVTSNGQPVGMASVVAISPSNEAVSSMTNPDGTYSITVPPGVYEVYVHPVPPPQITESTPGNIVWPKDDQGNSFPLPGSAFVTQFYPGTQDFFQAAPISVNPASVTTGVNFDVQSKPYVTLGPVRTYGYSDTNVPIASPPISISSNAAMVAYGTGLMQDANTLEPGLDIFVLGSGSASTAQVYNLLPWQAGYMALDVALGYFAGTGPKHLLFRQNGDIYVLPSAFRAVSQAPPFISSVTATTDSNGNRIVQVSGTNLFADSTRILFDGLPGFVTGASSDGSLLVVPPPAPGSYNATVTALNADGQSSNYLQAAKPPVYVYDTQSPPSVAVTAGSLSPGDNTIDVVSANTNFVDGQVIVGFGTSDVVVTEVQVLSPTHLVVKATLNTNANVPTININIVNGLSLIAQSQGSTITEQPPQTQ